MKLQLKESAPGASALPAFTGSSPEAFEGNNLEAEVESMVSTLMMLSDGPPDAIMRACMAYMGRCTEIWMQLLRIEQSFRQAKTFRVMQLQKTMDLIEFQFKGASRLIEVARQEVELSR